LGQLLLIARLLLAEILREGLVVPLQHLRLALGEYLLGALQVLGLALRGVRKVRTGFLKVLARFRIAPV